MTLSKHVAKIGKLGSIYAIAHIVPQIVGLFLLRVFTDYLDTEQMGIVALATQVMLPLTALVSMGLWSGLKSHYFRVAEAKRPVLVRSVFIAQGVQIAVLFGLGALAGIWIADHLLPNLPLDNRRVYLLWLMILGACSLQVVVKFGQGVAQLQERAGISVCISLCQYLVQMGLGVAVVVWLGWGGFGRQGTIVAGLAVAAVIAGWVVWRAGAGRFDRPLWRRTALTGLTFVPASLSGLLAPAVTIWLLNKLVSAEALGVYGVANRFGPLLPLLLFALGQAAYPTLARLMSEGTPEAKRQQSRLYTLMVIGVCLLALGLWLLSPTMIRLIVRNPAYHDAAYVVPIIVFAYFFQGMYLLVFQRVFYIGGGLWLAAATLSSLAVTVGLCFLLIPLLGMYGAAWAMVGGSATRFTVSAITGEMKYPLPWEFSKLARILACTAVPVGLDVLAGWYWRPSLLMEISLKVILVLVMLVLLRATNAVTAAELAQGRKLIAEKLRSMLGGTNK